MIEIIPAIMPKSFGDLREKMSLVSGLVPLAQIDVMDGVFVPNKSWPYIKKPDPDFQKILKEEDAFPYWEELDFEADLMVSNPEAVVPDWITAGAKRLIIHIESLDSAKDGKSDGFRAVFERIKSRLPDEDSFLYTEIGVAINPDTSNEKLEPILDCRSGVSCVDFVQFMGITKIGFQGQTFDERVYDKISRLRTIRPDVTISVDGGVNLETAPKLVAAGANRLAVGSTLFESEDLTATIEKFFEIAGSAENVPADDDSRKNDGAPAENL